MISLAPSRSQLICSLFLYISFFLSSLPFLHLSSRLSALFLSPLYLTLDIPLISLSISQYHLLLSPLSISPLIYSSACLSLPLSLHPLLYLALCIFIYPLQFSRLSLFSFSISISFISFSTSPFTTISLCLTSVLSHSHWHSIFSLSSLRIVHLRFLLSPCLPLSLCANLEPFLCFISPSLPSPHSILHFYISIQLSILPSLTHLVSPLRSLSIHSLYITFNLIHPVSPHSSHPRFTSLCSLQSPSLPALSICLLLSHRSPFCYSFLSFKFYIYHLSLSFCSLSPYFTL